MKVYIAFTNSGHRCAFLTKQLASDYLDALRIEDLNCGWTFEYWIEELVIHEVLPCT